MSVIANNDQGRAEESDREGEKEVNARNGKAIIIEIEVRHSFMTSRSK